MPFRKNLTFVAEVGKTVLPEKPVPPTLPAGKLAATETRSSAQIEEVTIAFKSPRPVGHFISGNLGQGDVFVVGETVVTGWTPAPGIVSGSRRGNGGVVNVRVGSESPFDSIWSYYEDALNVGNKLPVTLKPWDTLMIAVSDPSASSAKNSIKKFVTLTCLPQTPPADAFRPGYTGPTKELFRYSDVQEALFMDVNIAKDMPEAAAPATVEPTPRFFPDFVSTFRRDFQQSPGHVSPYGRDNATHYGTPQIAIFCDYPPEVKKALAIDLIQLGIDTWQVFKQARIAQGESTVWGADGGHNHSRLARILVAGKLLGHADMLNIVRDHLSPGLDGSTSHGSFRGGMQEQAQCFYVTKDDVAMTASSTWSPSYGDRSKDGYEEAMIGTPDWIGKGFDFDPKSPGGVNASFRGHPYRYGDPIYPSKHGEFCALMMLGLRPNFGWDAHFDYTIREIHMKAGLRDPWAFRGGKTRRYRERAGSDYSWSNWERYRDRWQYWWLRNNIRRLGYTFPWGEVPSFKEMPA